MRILLIETSTSQGEIALADLTSIVATRPLAAARKQARDLAPALNDLLLEQKWAPASIDLVIADIGPGSYTGLRVGLMSAKTFCYATKADVVGIDTMTVLAAAVNDDEQKIHTIVDAQQGMIYVAEFDRSAAAPQLRCRIPTEIVAATEWAEALESKTYVTGPAVDRFKAIIPSHCRYASDDARNPDIRSLHKVGVAEYQSGRRDDFWKLEPLYLRPSAAEENWAKRHGTG